MTLKAFDCHQWRIQEFVKGGGAENRKGPSNRERSEQIFFKLFFMGTSFSLVFKRNYVNVPQWFSAEI